MLQSPLALEGLGKQHDGFCVGFSHLFRNTPPSSSSKLPKMNFPSFDGKTQSYGLADVKITLTCIQSSLVCGSK
jgi:hypothetical protein